MATLWVGRLKAAPREAPPDAAAERHPQALVKT
jgi:hypothetical protein